MKFLLPLVLVYVASALFDKHPPAPNTRNTVSGWIQAKLTGTAGLLGIQKASNEDEVNGEKQGNPCDTDNGGCSDICEYDGHFPTCSCPSDKQQLSSDHHTCILNDKNLTPAPVTSAPLTLAPVTQEPTAKVKLECVKEGNSVMGGYKCCSGLAGVTKKIWDFEITVCPKPTNAPETTLPTCKRENRECAENMDCCEDLVCHKMKRNAFTGKTTGRCSRNPCDTDNGGCSDICSYDGQFPTCSCSSDKQQLSSDHHTCTDCVGKDRSLPSSERQNFAIRHMPRKKDVCCKGLVEKRLAVYKVYDNGYGVIFCRDPKTWKKKWDFIEESVKAPAHAGGICQGKLSTWNDGCKTETKCVATNRWGRTRCKWVGGICQGKMSIWNDGCKAEAKCVATDRMLFGKRVATRCKWVEKESALAGLLNELLDRLDA